MALRRLNPAENTVWYPVPVKFTRRKRKKSRFFAKIQDKIIIENTRQLQNPKRSGTTLCTKWSTTFVDQATPSRQHFKT